MDMCSSIARAVALSALVLTGAVGLSNAQTWTPIPPLSSPRELSGVATGADGKVYVAGGNYISISNTSSTLEAYDPATSSWQVLASMPAGRTALGLATGTDGKIYAVGGYDGSSNTGTSEVYDPATNTWSEIAPLPTPRRLLALVAASDGLIYAIGGYTDAGDVPTVEAFDPSTGTWSSRTPLPKPREFVGAAVSGGRIYVIGGFRDGGPSSSVEAYDIATATWTTVAPTTVPRAETAAATGKDGRIYVFGGVNNVDGPLNSAESYDPSSNTWTMIASMTVARQAHGGTAGLDGTIYAIGGAVGSSDSASAETFLPATADTSPPMTILGSSGPAGQNGWYRGMVTVTLSATDPDGAADVAHTYYTVDGGSQQTYSGPFTVSGDGTHTVSYWSVDKSGNEEKPHPTQSIQIDATPPAVSFGSPSPAPNSYGWNNSAVDLGYTVSDSTSGVAGATSGTLHFSAEGAGQTQSVTMTDLAGNTAVVTSPAVNIDLTPPTVSISTPAQGATYLLNQSVTVGFNCTDALSGILSFGSSLAQGAQVPTSAAGSFSFTVSAQDKAGNSSTATSSYSVGYAIQPLYDQTKAVKSGAVIPIKLQLNDANGKDVSSSGIVVHAVSVSMASTNAPGQLEDAGNANPDNDFRFDSSLGTSGGYIFNLKTTGLSTGTWNLSFTAGADPAVHLVQFQVK